MFYLHITWQRCNGGTALAPNEWLLYYALLLPSWLLFTWIQQLGGSRKEGLAIIGSLRVMIITMRVNYKIECNFAFTGGALGSCLCWSFPIECDSIFLLAEMERVYNLSRSWIIWDWRHRLVWLYSSHFPPFWPLGISLSFISYRAWDN